ncbi:hypothetical protein [Taklimakanibacter deserti]|uniref:hypothetical protein n=1 Tax=Taklimakanibacter deserti TaxID=2267839 RepID=UPI0013C4CBDE
MADKHPSGNPDLVEQHKKIQREGDKELAESSHDAPRPGQRKETPERAPAGRDSDNSGSKSDGGSFVGP